MSGKSLSKDFTKGDIKKQLLWFALPFMASNALQVLYSTIDMIIVGKYVGTAGLSAVSQSSLILNFATMVCLGFSNGGQILVAQALGAGKRKEMNDIIGTLFTQIVCIAVALTAIFLVGRTWILDVMNIPTESYDMAMDYLIICGLGLIFTAGYNMVEEIRRLYPDAVASYNRDGSDYVYLAEDLAELKGKKYHSKRNHLNRFYENDWSFEPITHENMSECIAMNEIWCSENICEFGCDDNDSRSKEDESCIVRCSFKYYDKLGYKGGLIRVNGEAQAFCFGEEAADDTFVVHVEKALRNYQGAYTAINREFVRSLCGRYKYINREEDTGEENLRKAKLSYYPVFLEDKFDITFGG